MANEVFDPNKDDVKIRRLRRTSKGKKVSFSQNVMPETANIFYDYAREHDLLMWQVLERAAHALKDK